MLWDWQEERELDLASEEVASAIREAQMMVKSGHEDITMAAMSVTFYCDEEAGACVVPHQARGEIHPAAGGRCLPISVHGGRLYVVFRKDGFAGSEGNGKYTMRLRTKDGKHEKEITVAMYTGACQGDEDQSVTLVCVNIHERTVEVKYIVIICEWKFHAFFLSTIQLYSLPPIVICFAAWVQVLFLFSIVSNNFNSTWHKPVVVAGGAVVLATLSC